MQVDGVAVLDCGGFDLDRISKGGHYLDDLADLEEAVLAFVLCRKVKIESDIVEAVGHFEHQFTAISVIAAARLNVPRIFDDGDDVGSHVGFNVQERAFPNMVFLAHFLFLVNKLLKNVDKMRHLSELGRAEQSRGGRLIVTRTLECKHSVCLLFD